MGPAFFDLATWSFILRIDQQAAEKLANSAVSGEERPSVAKASVVLLALCGG